MPSESRLVVALTYKGLCAFEFGIAAEIFGLARPEFDFPWYRFAVLPSEPGISGLAGGIVVERLRSTVSAIDKAHTVIVPGWRGCLEKPSSRIVDLVQRAMANGARLVSLCGGSFVLAEAGALDGRRVATHWMFVEELRRRYPSIEVDPNALYVDDGNVLTSAGSAAGIDLCLHIVRQDYGTSVVNRVAKRLLAQPYREGGQSQFIVSPVPTSRVGRLSNLLDWMSTNLSEDLTMGEIARKSGLSERSLFRQFRTSTGMSPKEWLLRERIRRAQQLLETERLGIDQVGHACGFKSSEAFRYHFRRFVRNSPTQYRRAFREDGER